MGNVYGYDESIFVDTHTSTVPFILLKVHFEFMRFLLDLPQSAEPTSAPTLQAGQKLRFGENLSFIRLRFRVYSYAIHVDH